MTDGQPNDQPPRLQIANTDGITHVVFPRHYTDGNCVRELYEFAAALSNEPKAKLHINMRSLPMVTSGMAGILVQIQKVLRHTAGQVHVTVPDELMFMQFRAMHLHQLLKLFYTEEEAIAGFE